ncbi:hypothetical protein [Marinibacterium profundimaris]|nr:hypothetical protein [Marinibacterium profundimaris]
MRSAICLMILATFVAGCETWEPGRAEAVMDASERPGRAHAAALAGDDVGAMRRTGAELLAVVSLCWGSVSC